VLRFRAILSRIHKAKRHFFVHGYREDYSSLSCLSSDPAGGGSREILTSSSKGGFLS
jgi:hypothetical protein